MKAIISLFFIPVLFSIAGCQTAYYSTMESLGKHKRDILVDRVESAQEAQTDAQEQFQSALEQLSSLITFDGGDLQVQYDKTKSQYDASKESAEKVTQRIDDIDSVANALFDEWQNEIEEYSSASLQRQSSQKLKETERRYQRFIKSMRKAESKMYPVLEALQDNTLYLKHNLNANAIGALEVEYKNIKNDIDLLIKDMAQAIKESQSFISLIKPEN